VYDFVLPEWGRATPYGVYDLAANAGWVNVGLDRDTAAFAVESIRRWWEGDGRARYPAAHRLLITADGGGSNGSRRRLWTWELQRLADETGPDDARHHGPDHGGQAGGRGHRRRRYGAADHVHRARRAGRRRHRDHRAGGARHWRQPTRRGRARDQAIARAGRGPGGDHRGAWAYLRPSHHRPARRDAAGGAGRRRLPGHRLRHVGRPGHPARLLVCSSARPRCAGRATRVCP